MSELAPRFEFPVIPEVLGGDHAERRAAAPDNARLVLGEVRGGERQDDFGDKDFGGDKKDRRETTRVRRIRRKAVDYHGSDEAIFGHAGGEDQAPSVRAEKGAPGG